VSVQQKSVPKKSRAPNSVEMKDLLLIVKNKNDVMDIVRAMQRKKRKIRNAVS
jgi:hypothetical protein